MRSAFRLVCLGLLAVACEPVHAQLSQPAVSLQLDGEPQTIQIPARALLYDPQCDSSGAIYVRYVPAGDSGPTKLVRAESDGSTQTIPPVAIPQGNDSHVFLFAVAGDDSLHEMLRVPVDDGNDTEVQYVSFDKDGSPRTQAKFTDQMIPSMLLPLPNGDFFAAGVILQTATGGVSEGPIAGIFSPDAQLKQRLQNTSSGLARVSNADQNSSSDIPLEGAIIRLGGDGNLYILLSADNARIEVLSQAGRVLRRMHLEQPFANGVADDMFVSGNRLLVVYEGEADEGKNTLRYVVYDAQTGEVIRQYQPEFSGTAACFEDGDSVTVLVREPSSGAIAIGTAELE